MVQRSDTSTLTHSAHSQAVQTAKHTLDSPQSWLGHKLVQIGPLKARRKFHLFGYPSEIACLYSPHLAVLCECIMKQTHYTHR